MDARGDAGKERFLEGKSLHLPQAECAKQADDEKSGKAGHLVGAKNRTIARSTDLALPIFPVRPCSNSADRREDL
jgi:hypothetical protein